jgi:hypothetical protein
MHTNGHEPEQNVAIETQSTERLMIAFPESLAPWSLCLCGDVCFMYSSPFAIGFICVNLRPSAVEFCGFKLIVYE